jgi:hypothetical protein
MRNALPFGVESGVLFLVVLCYLQMRSQFHHAGQSKACIVEAGILPCQRNMRHTSKLANLPDLNDLQKLSITASDCNSSPTGIVIGHCNRGRTEARCQQVLRTQHEGRIGSYIHIYFFGWGSHL